MPDEREKGKWPTLLIGESSTDPETGRPFYFYLVDADADQWSPWFETWTPREADGSYEGRVAAERLVACWNAMLPYDDPAAFVARAAALEAEVARLRKAMEKVSAACPKYDPKKWRDDYCDCEDRHDTMLGDIGDDVRQALQGAVEPLRR